MLDPAPPSEGGRGSPSPFVSPAMRKAMGEQCVALARAVGYYSAGTVELIVSGADKSGESFYSK
jgi:propionyl-CoA carboxylase alpha chain